MTGEEDPAVTERKEMESISMVLKKLEAGHGSARRRRRQDSEDSSSSEEESPFERRKREKQDRIGLIRRMRRRPQMLLQRAQGTRICGVSLHRKPTDPGLLKSLSDLFLQIYSCVS